MKKVCIFIDAANILYSQRSLGWTIDFKKFFTFFKKASKKLNGIYFYYALWFEDDYKRIAERKMLKMLNRNGYTVVTKKSKKIKNRVKGNCDVELTIDAIRFADRFDTFILLSGDGDFASLCNYLKTKGKKAIVISHRGHVALELIKSANFYIPLSRFRKFLEYKSKKAPKGFLDGRSD